MTRKHQRTMGNINLIIQLFGAFREYGKEVHLTLPKGASCADVKHALVDALGNEARGLIEASALADEKKVLGQEEQIMDSGGLAILPPVCGG